MRSREPTTGQARIALVGAAGAGGVAGWLLLGPWWAVAGVVAGPAALLIAYGVVRSYVVPAPWDHMADHEPYLALAETRSLRWSSHVMARWWPGQFLEPPACHLLVEGEALLALGRRVDALGPAAEAAAIYQDLAAQRSRKFEAGLAGALRRQSRLLAAAGSHAEAAAAARVAARLYRNLAVPAPWKYLPALAESLTSQAASLSEAGQDGAALEAATEAAGICQEQLAGDDQPVCAAQALLLKGRLLAAKARYREAAGPLAKGWQLAVSREQEDLQATAAEALRAAYRADPAAVLDAWHIEADGEPPDWLTGPPASSS